MSRFVTLFWVLVKRFPCINLCFPTAQSEVYDDPSSVQSPQFPYQDTAQVFLFSRPASKREDLHAATALAWRLRGLALLVLVHR